LLHGSTGLLHLLDRREGFIVLAGLFTREEVKDADLAVGQGQRDKVGGIR
jgi:hypothetical protein